VRIRAYLQKKIVPLLLSHAYSEIKNVQATCYELNALWPYYCMKYWEMSHSSSKTIRLSYIWSCDSRVDYGNSGVHPAMCIENSDFHPNFDVVEPLGQEFFLHRHLAIPVYGPPKPEDCWND